MKTYTSPERKLKKVMVEKRRRMRIDRALLQMKHMVLEALSVQPEKYAKMEKADILDLTVRFLKKMRHERLCQGLTPAQQPPAVPGLPGTSHPYMPTALHPMAANMAAQPIPVPLPRGGVPYYPTAFKAEIPTIKTEGPQDLSYPHQPLSHRVPPHPSIHGLPSYAYPRAGPSTSAAVASTCVAGPSTSGLRPRSHTLSRPLSPIVLSDSSTPDSDPKGSPALQMSPPVLRTKDLPVAAAATSCSSATISVKPDSPVAHAFVRVDIQPSTSRGVLRPTPSAAAGSARALRAAAQPPIQPAGMDDMWRPW